MMDWLEQQLGSPEIDNQSTLECLEKLAQYCSNLQNEFGNLNDWKLVSPKIRKLLKTYGSCIRNRLENLSTIEKCLLAPLNDTVRNLHDLAKEFWKKEINIGVVCWTVLMEILKTVPLNALEDFFLEKLYVTILQLASETFKNWGAKMSPNSSFLKMTLFVSKLVQDLMDLSLDVFLEPKVLPYLIDTWCQAMIHLDPKKCKDNGMESVEKMSHNLSQLAAVVLLEAPNLFGRVWLDSLDGTHSKEDWYNILESAVHVANILKYPRVSDFPEIERRKEISLSMLFHFCLMLIQRRFEDRKMLLDGCNERYHLATSLVLILEDALNFSSISISRAIDYLFFHITGADALVRLLCMNVFKYVVRRNKIPNAKFHDLQRKLSELIFFAELFECKAITLQLTLLRTECFENCLVRDSSSWKQQSKIDPITGSRLTTTSESEVKTELNRYLNDPNDLASCESLELFKIENASNAYEAYCFLSSLKSRKWTFAEACALLQPMMHCAGRWNVLFVITCELLLSAITCYPELTASDAQFISFIKSSFRKIMKLANHHCKGGHQQMLLFDTHCFLVLMQLTTTYCRFAPETCVQRLGKDPLLADCLRSILLKQYLLQIPTSEMEEFQDSLLTNSAFRPKMKEEEISQGTETELSINHLAFRKASTRLFLVSILEWTESHRHKTLEQVWLQIRHCLDALFLKDSQKDNIPTMQ